MRAIKSGRLLIFLLLPLTFLVQSCGERIPEWFLIDFNRCIKGRVVTLGSTSPVKDATIKIWINGDTVNGYYGSSSDTLVLLTDDKGCYRTKKISEKLWLNGELVIAASKQGYETANWKSNATYASEYDPLTEIWSRDDKDTLYVNFGLKSLWNSCEVSPGVLYFGNNLITLPLYILNTGAGQLDWEISHSNSWIQLTQNSGQIPVSQFVQVLILIDRSSLIPGTYTDNLEITTNANTGDNPLVVPVYVTVD